MFSFILKYRNRKKRKERNERGRRDKEEANSQSFKALLVDVPGVDGEMNINSLALCVEEIGKKIGFR